MLSAPDEGNDFHSEHAHLLISSYRHWTGKELFTSEGNDFEKYKALYLAAFPVLSHDTSEDPVFNYGNLAAQKLFEMDWETLTSHPSRHSAEPVNRAERDRLLKRVTEQGYIDDYRGTRISATGKRFRIDDAFIWNLIDSEGAYLGQAAALFKWTLLPPTSSH